MEAGRKVDGEGGIEEVVGVGDGVEVGDGAIRIITLCIILIINNQHVT